MGFGVCGLKGEGRDASVFRVASEYTAGSQVSD